MKLNSFFFCRLGPINLKQTTCTVSQKYSAFHFFSTENTVVVIIKGCCSFLMTTIELIVRAVRSDIYIGYRFDATQKKISEYIGLHLKYRI